MSLISDVHLSIKDSITMFYIHTAFFFFLYGHVALMRNISCDTFIERTTLFLLLIGMASKKPSEMCVCVCAYAGVCVCAHV